MRRLHRLFALVAFLISTPVVLAQTTWYVDDDSCPGPGTGASTDPFCKIQDAIAAASDGDTVLVLPGVYAESVDCLGKGIALVSRDGPDVTLIDGTGHRWVLVMNVPNAKLGRLEGFTMANAISHEWQYGQAGVDCRGNVVVTRNVITRNSGQYSGGLFCRGAVTVTDNEIRDNGGGFGTGGVIARGQTLIARNRIVDNGSGLGSAGVSCSDGVVVEDNDICGNWLGDAFTAGVDASGSVIIRGNRIVNNDSDQGEVGGICVYGGDQQGGSALVEGNVISFNGKGGIAIHGGAPMILNNVITDNPWLAIRCDQAMPTLANNTIARNDNGMWITGGSDVLMTNTIFWDNGHGISISGYTPSRLDISYCDLEGGQDAIRVDPGCVLQWGAGMIDQDPVFAGASASRPVSGMRAIRGDRHHLTALSPCINRGTSVGAPALDADGDPRPFMGSVDIGADEYVGEHLLGADRFSLPGSSGGAVHLALAAGASHRREPYLVLGSASGTAPGLPLPGGHAILPLTWDAFTSLVLRLANTPAFASFSGALDDAGRGVATFDSLGPLPPESVGLTLSFAYAIVDGFRLASSPIDVEISP